MSSCGAIVQQPWVGSLASMVPPKALPRLTHDCRVRSKPLSTTVCGPKTTKETVLIIHRKHLIYPTICQSAMGKMVFICEPYNSGLQDKSNIQWLGCLPRMRLTQIHSPHMIPKHFHPWERSGVVHKSDNKNTRQCFVRTKEIVSRAFAFYEVDSGSLPNTTYGVHQALTGMILEHCWLWHQKRVYRQ